MTRNMRNLGALAGAAEARDQVTGGDGLDDTGTSRGWQPTTRGAADAQLARVQALGDAVDRELDGDRRFFRRRPHRTYRLRRSFKAEGEQVAILSGWPLKGPCTVYTIVCQIAPGVRLRAFFLAQGHLVTDVPEAEVARLFNRLIPAAPSIDNIAEAAAAARAERMQ